MGSSLLPAFVARTRSFRNKEHRKIDSEGLQAYNDCEWAKCDRVIDKNLFGIKMFKSSLFLKMRSLLEHQSFDSNLRKFLTM